MKLLFRDISSYRFMTLGGLVSRLQLPDVSNIQVPAQFQEAAYRAVQNSFGPDEENVRRFIMDLLSKGLGWTTVNKSHDVLAKHGQDKLLIECKRFNSQLLYLEDHRGGSANESSVEELHRNLTNMGIRWGVLTDGVTFRLYYNAPNDPSVQEAFMEICLKDIIDSTHRWPEEIYWLIDFLSPNSQIRSMDPTVVTGLPDAHFRRIMRLLKSHQTSLRTIIKAFAVAALEDMGIRPLHRGIQSIKNATTKREFNAVFSSIPSNDPDFHTGREPITDALCGRLHALFAQMADVDFAHVDHEFFGEVYQRFINNGNASHYTNSSLSKEMANYIANRSDKSQRGVRPIRIQEGDYIVDPALGSGQLLRGLLPFHKVFFSGQTQGIDGWRALAGHFLGRDIDGEAIWVAKINIWIATAKKGEPFVRLDEFKKLDVISATINRRAGASIREALEIDEDKHIVACVSNPPWDAFKNDRRRGVQFDASEAQKIRRSLAITSRQLNRAQIFLRIIHLLGEECENMRLSVVLPDSFFVDTNDSLRECIRPNLDFYFSYPRNFDPVAKKRIFSSVDNTRKFGIIFGRSTTQFQNVVCYPLGRDTAIPVDDQTRRIGQFNVFPLFSHPAQFRVVQSWRRQASRFPRWREGEFHQTNWANVSGRRESTTGTNIVVGGASFCDETSAWARMPVLQNRFWKQFSRVSTNDNALRATSRTVFSDYINNSKKLNSATYIDSQENLNLTNTCLYSQECLQNDWLIYDSVIFSVLVEAYGTSQHMNAFRLTALGLPAALTQTTSVAANVELCMTLGLTLADCEALYDVYQSWMGLAFSKEQWLQQVGANPATPQDITH